MSLSHTEFGCRELCDVFSLVQDTARKQLDPVAVCSFISVPTGTVQFPLGLESWSKVGRNGQKWWSVLRYDCLHFWGFSSLPHGIWIHGAVGSMVHVFIVLNGFLKMLSIFTITKLFGRLPLICRCFVVFEDFPELISFFDLSVVNMCFTDCYRVLYIQCIMFLSFLKLYAFNVFQYHLASYCLFIFNNE